MAFPDITQKISFEEHINFTARNLDPELSVDDIVDGVKRLTVAPDQFKASDINGVRVIGAISTLIKAKTQSS